MTKLLSYIITATTIVMLVLTVGCKKQDDEIPMYWEVNGVTDIESIKVDILNQGYPAHINIDVTPNGGELTLLCQNLSNEFKMPCFYLLWDSDIPGNMQAPFEKLSNDWCEVAVSYNKLKFKFSNRLPDENIKEITLDVNTAQGYTRIKIKGIP